MTQAAVILDPAISAGLGQWGAIQSAAPSLGLEVIPVRVRDARETLSATLTPKTATRDAAGAPRTTLWQGADARAEENVNSTRAE